jgi:NAD(P)-dependent dehydrogenase (short-subunit alcohol dehydrogenase family)
LAAWWRSEIVRTLGPVDILVNHAGITRDATLHKMTPAQWHSVIEVDLGSCFNMCRAVIESMRARRFGRIVNIGSVNSLAGQFGQTNYAAAKAGMIFHLGGKLARRSPAPASPRSAAPSRSRCRLRARTQASQRQSRISGRSSP